jgi:hypothetical protein
MFLLMLGWINIILLTIYPLAWVVEQTMILVGLEWPVWLWPLITLGCGLLILIPLVPLALLWRIPLYRTIFQTWAMSAVFIFFLVPMRFVRPNGAQTANLLQIIGVACYLGVLIFIKSRQQQSKRSFIRLQGSLVPALMLIPFLIWSWLVWGALGSWLDTLLNLLSGLSFGIAACMLFDTFLWRPPAQTNHESVKGITRGGFVLGTSLLMMATAFGFNGSEILLMIVLPSLAWLLMVVATLKRWVSEQDQAEENWFSVALLIGLVAAAPLMLVDPDELVWQLNFGSRDILYWGLSAALVTMLSAWIMGVLLILVRHFISRYWTSKMMKGFVASLWLIAGFLYLVIGQPGFYGDHLFVVLHDQADVSSANAIQDYNQRRQYVYEALVKQANQTQADLRFSLERLRIPYIPYYLVNSMEVNAGPFIRLWVSLRPEVKDVYEIPVLRPLPAPVPMSTGSAPAPTGPQWNLTNIGADRVWKELGVTGQGIVVGQSDSGVQWNHPELRDAYRGFDSTTQLVTHDYNWMDPWNKTTQPNDVIGHGTHTTGSIVGKTVGVAPGAKWFACLNQERNLGNPPRYLDCMQFMLAPYPLNGDPFKNGDPALGAHIMNDSWGCPNLEGCRPDSLLPAARALRAAGIFVVASVGNDGSRCESVDYPMAIYGEVFSVGAVDSLGKLAEFSSRGPVVVDGSNRVKPDIVAPGVEVLSSFPGDTYAYVDGTSMAGPHVVGVVALMWSATPNLIGDIDATEAILRETAKPYQYPIEGDRLCANGLEVPNNAVGYGLIDAYAAVKRALELKGNNP